MISIRNFGWLAIFSVLVLLSSNSLAAGKCTEARTESTFELINAPAEEMLNARNSSATNCVFLKDFMARVNSKSGTRNNSASGGAYVPKTKFDNTPWRFDMNQNGKRMTSEEFDAWMKAKGIRVATGKPGAETPPSAPECKPSKTEKC